MAKSALDKLVKAFKTPQHDLKLNTEIFGQFDADKVAKELSLELVGAEKGEKNQPSTETQIPDEVETQIQERIEAAKASAHESAENQIHAYNERISNLDFEGHFSELRQSGPIALSDIDAQIQRGLNDMNTRRRKLLDVEKEFEHFRTVNNLKFRTAKVVSSTEAFLRVLIILIMITTETYFNGTFLGKGNSQGIIGGAFEAATFALLNIGFSIILTNYVIKQIVRPNFFWKLVGSAGVVLWLALVCLINLFLAHYREAASAVMTEDVLGATQDVLGNLYSSPLALQDPESWMLFGIGMLFAFVTLVDVLTFSDIFPGYSKRQNTWDEAQEDYKDEFDYVSEALDDIKEEYRDQLKEIGDALSLRQKELDTILSGRNRLVGLYAAHHEHLQRAANSLFSYYYEANKIKRTTPVPDRFNKRHIVAKMVLTTNEAFQPREAQKIKDRITEAKDILDTQIQLVLDKHADGLKQYRNLDILNREYEYGEEPKIQEETQ